MGEKDPWRPYTGVEVNAAEEEEGSSVNCVGWRVSNGFGIREVGRIKHGRHNTPCVAIRLETRTAFYCTPRGSDVSASCVYWETREAYSPTG